jgi:LmbE family N-acetylglucosaminyl deacetylase
MLRFIPATKKSEPLKLLFLGAHSDDIEIGCGASILRILEEYPGTQVHWVVFSSIGKREDEARRSADFFLKKAGSKILFLQDYADGFFPYIGADIKIFLEKVKNIVSPDIIFSHYRKDLHQDHRLVSELTWNTFRDHLILEYEIFKYDGDIGSPNLFIHVSNSQCENKIDHLMNAFKSQHNRTWFNRDVFSSLMRIRGIECNAPENFAEAFYCRKITF